MSGQKARGTAGTIRGGGTRGAGSGRPGGRRRRPDRLSVASPPETRALVERAAADAD